jgi:hypothetical protein
MDILIYLLVGFALGYSLGTVITTIRTARAFKSILEDLGVTTEQLLKLRDKIDQPEAKPQADAEIEIRLETHNGQIYAYRKDNSQFLAQGPDRDRLIQHLNYTFANGARLIIREQDGAELVKP